MRLFVALEIPEPVRREVRRRIAGLRERLPRARWVNPDVLHLTLLFLGEVPADGAVALASRLRDAFAPFPAMSLRLAGAGTFPAGRPARVAWIGVAAPPELVPLQAAVAQAAREALGPPAAPAAPEERERPYRPHVTLARCPSPWPRGAAEKFAAAFPGEIGPPFLATHGVLVESKLSPKGPRYRDLAELSLAGAAGAAGAADPADPADDGPALGDVPALAADRDSGTEP
ncbi:MAG TPA: RNA 2',3'-cyclic phosphodiesterase [Thermoanaerobaculia bacterium]|jgi:2'-5' RNA ligase|nr:RNA 2',3'-cyclic phosphodiesterase [Thermoanaerobaculia bacterium]